MYIDDAIEIKKPVPDSHFRLIPCGNCHGDNVAYIKYLDMNQEKFRISCFDCGYTVKPENAVCAHDAQLVWNGKVGAA